MKTNVGGFDGMLRTLLFVIALIYAVMSGSWLWLIAGAILFGTALITWCPVYEMIGFSSHKEIEKT